MNAPRPSQAERDAAARDAWVARTLAKFPPLTEEQRARYAVLLRPSATRHNNAA